jgi:hypothetical protein
VLSWLKKRRNFDAAKKTAMGAQIAINRMGELIEAYPGAVIDETWLPVPKADMKTALKIGWITAPNEKERELMRVGYSLLASFQPGVGEKPISPKLPENPSPEDAIKILGPYLEFSPRVEAEMVANGKEFDAFVKSQRT